MTPAYLELRAGEVEFNAANLGEDDHDFSVRDAAAATSPPSRSGPARATPSGSRSAPASTRCSARSRATRRSGMRADVTVR